METATINIEKYDQLKEKERLYNDVTKQFNDLKKGYEHDMIHALFGFVLNLARVHKVNEDILHDAMTKAGYTVTLKQDTGHNTSIGKGAKRIFVENSKIISNV